MKKKKLCFNRFQKGHSANICTSQFTCKYCHLRHHTFVQRPKSHNIPTGGTNKENSSSHNLSRSNSETEEPTSKFTTRHFSTQGTFNTPLLPVVLVSIRDASGTQVSLRAMLDSGAQASFIKADKAKFLMVTIKRSQSSIQTLGSDSARSQRTCGLLPNTLNDTVDINLLIIPRLTKAIISRDVDTSLMKHVHNLDFADPQLNTPRRIDILLGADLLEDLLLDNKSKINGLFLKESIYGSVVSRPAAEKVLVVGYTTIIGPQETENLLRKFWEVETVPEGKLLTREEKMFEQHFDTKAKRQA